jgi:hypothetical protein
MLFIRLPANNRRSKVIGNTQQKGEKFGQGHNKDMCIRIVAATDGGVCSYGHLVFSTPAEDFCKCLYRKQLAAKRREYKNEQKCAGFERVLNKSVQVLRRNERFLRVF